MALNLHGYSTTPASNTTVGGVSIAEGCPPGNVNDAERAIMADIKAALANTSSTIVAAGTTDLTGATGQVVPISGATTITALGTIAGGAEFWLRFISTPMLKNNASSLILPGGADITAAAGDVAKFISEGSGNWRCMVYVRASGKFNEAAISALTEDTAPDLTADFVPTYDASAAANKKVIAGRLGSGVLVADVSASGATVDFTGIPAWAKQITIMFTAVSTNGTSNPIIQIGDSGGIETSGYNGAGSLLSNGSSPIVTNFTTGFGVPFGSAANTIFGAVYLTMLEAAGNVWACTGSWGLASSTTMGLTAGTKATSAALDRVRITTVNGTDTFDAGTLAVFYQ